MEEDPNKNRPAESHGFPQFAAVSTSGFSMRRLDLKNDLGIACLAAGAKCLLVGIRKGLVLRKRLEPEGEFEPIVVPSESPIVHIFADVCGHHFIITTAANEAFYLPIIAQQIVLLPRLNGLHISALAFPLNLPETSTDYFLIGTHEGSILSYKISTSTIYQDQTTGKLVSDWDILTPVYDFPSLTHISGLVFDSFVQGKPTQTKLLVLVTTERECYKFVGPAPFSRLFSDFWDPKRLAKAKVPVDAGKMRRLNELRVQYNCAAGTKARVFELGAFAWRCSINVCCGSFVNGRAGYADEPDFSSDAYQRGGEVLASEDEAPASVAISADYVFMLYQDNLTVLGRNGKGLAYRFDFPFTESMQHMSFGPVENVLWLHSEGSLYKLSITCTMKASWEHMLEKRDYQAALELSGSDPANRCYVSARFASKLFSDKRYFDAAEYFAQSGQPFEQVVLRFLPAEPVLPEEYSALRSGLERNLPHEAIPDRIHVDHTCGKGTAQRLSGAGTRGALADAHKARRHYTASEKGEGGRRPERQRRFHALRSVQLRRLRSEHIAAGDGGPRTGGRWSVAGRREGGI